jgi:ABC-type sulfate/molybdate transport systems ATPase subunit
MRQYFLTIPRDLEEAAKLDGAGYFKTFWKVMLPLAGPAIAAVAILEFQGTWNDFFWPLIICCAEPLHDPVGIARSFGVPDALAAADGGERDRDRADRSCSISSSSATDGEFMVLVGPSGCGKTTALRMIAGLEEITDGEIRSATASSTTSPPRDRDIAMVFQNYALYPHMTVRENIALRPEAAQGAEGEIEIEARREARASSASSLLLDRKPAQLSGGQRQRVAMGRAIVREPQAFLMDEPLSNLDAKLRVQMRAEIARSSARLGVTTIYVTHDQVEAMTMGDRVAVMRDGVLQQVDTPQELYDRPANLFVAGFIGSPAMRARRRPRGR